MSDERPPAGGEDPAGLVADLQSGDNRREMQALMKLTRMRPAAPDPDVAAALVHVLQEGKALGVRLNAVKALEVWGTPDSLPALQKSAEGSNATLQLRAQSAIEAINSRK